VDGTLLNQYLEEAKDNPLFVAFRAGRGAPRKRKSAAGSSGSGPAKARRTGYADTVPDSSSTRGAEALAMLRNHPAVVDASISDPGGSAHLQFVPQAVDQLQQSVQLQQGLPSPLPPPVMVDACIGIGGILTVRQVACDCAFVCLFLAMPNPEGKPKMSNQYFTRCLTPKYRIEHTQVDGHARCNGQDG
jgi:hypothetical protein